MLSIAFYEAISNACVFYLVQILWLNFSFQEIYWVLNNPRSKSCQSSRSHYFEILGRLALIRRTHVIFDQVIRCKVESHRQQLSYEGNIETKIKTSDSMSFIDVSDCLKFSCIALRSSTALFLHNNSNMVSWSLYIKGPYNSECTRNPCEDTAN